MVWNVLSEAAKMAWDVVSGVTKTLWGVFFGGKSLWDVLSVVSKNGMGCFVLGYFIRLPLIGVAFKLITITVYRWGTFCVQLLQQVLFGLILYVPVNISFSHDCFETLPVCFSWSEYVHVLWIYFKD